ncbi:MAG TPA: YfhO family protein [Longimicrobiaceae bacterium]
MTDRQETERKSSHGGLSIGGWTALAIYFALAVAYFLPAFLPGQHIYGSDYLAGGYFFHEFISARFAEGALPKWVPYVYGGLPLFANPGSTYYPFRFLADLIFPVSKVWPTLFVIQFTLAGIGMYLLARELKARPWVAFVAGLTFQFTGVIMSWVLAGHEGRIIVATFLPLLFYLLHAGIRTASLPAFAGSAAVIGFCLLSFQIQNSYYLLLSGAIWAVFLIFSLGVHRDRLRLAKVLAMGLGAVAFGFALASVNFLPFLDYVAQSPRGESGGRGYEYSVSFSMPLPELSAVAVPELIGYLDTYRGTNPMKLHTEYVGAVVLLLAAVGFYNARRNRYWWLFVGLGVFALTIALGGSTPIYRLWYEILPGTKRFRAPGIAFFVVAFALVCMATLALERLAEAVEERTKPLRGIRGDDAELRVVPLILAAVVVVGFLLGGMAAGEAGPAAYRFALFAAGTGVILWLWLRGSMGTTLVALLLSAIAVLDLWIVDRDFFDTVPPPDEMFAADDVVNFLQQQPEPFRVWHLPFPAGMVYRGVAGNYLMHFGIEQAGGEHGNQLQRWNEYLGAGQETYVDWHNFLRDPQVVSTPEGGQAIGFTSTPGFLEAANVRYVVSAVPLSHPNLRLAYAGSAAVYEDTAALPRAYLVPEIEIVPGEDAALERMERDGFEPTQVALVSTDEPLEVPGGELTGEARVTEHEPDRVVVQANPSRPAMLVLADNYYQGWVARIDGEETPIYRVNHTLRGVVVPAGEHQVEFTYEPTDLFTGFYIYLVGMAILALYGLWLLVGIMRRRRVAHDV